MFDKITQRINYLNGIKSVYGHTTVVIIDTGNKLTIGETIKLKYVIMLFIPVSD